MKVYTYSQVQQNLAKILEEAQREGAIGIRRRDGRTFILKPERQAGSPLDVEGLNLGLKTDEIIEFIRESREYRA